METIETTDNLNIAMNGKERPNIGSQTVHHLWHSFHNKLKSQGKSDNTLKNYKTDMDCFKNYLLETQKTDSLAKIGLPEILEYGKFLETKYNSNNSRRRRVQTLRIFFDYLVETGEMSSNPVRKIPTSPKFVDIPRPTKFIDVKTLWMYLMQSKNGDGQLTNLINERNQVIFLLIYNAGLKVSDLAKLRVDQLSLGGQPRVMITPKNRDPYTIPLSNLTTKVIRCYLRGLESEKIRSSINFSELLFNANPHKILSGGLSSRGIEILMEDYRRKLSIEITPKSLRQSAIINWLNLGHNDSTVKEWMGVAPSYSMKDYKKVKEEYFFNDDALQEIYEHHQSH